MSASDESSPSESSARPSGGLGTIVLLLLAAGALRVLWGLQKGLVLDEFHTLYHASQSSWALFVDHLGQDNHPPLSFLIVGAARRVLGDADFALRQPAILAGLVELAVVLRIARTARVQRPLLAVALLAFSSLHMDCSTQARMYAFLALAVTLAVDALLRLGSGGGGRAAQVQLALAIGAGLHTHYFFAQYLLWLGVAWLAGYGLLKEHRADLKRVVIPVLLGVAMALPWYATVFRTQWGHELPPGGDEVGLRDLGEAFVHQFFLNVRLGGPARWLFVAAGVLVVILAGVGYLRLVRSEGSSSRFAGLVLGAVAFGVPAGAWTLARELPRAGFTWHYVLPSAAALALLAAHAASGRMQTNTLRATVAAALALCLLHLPTRGTEDYPGAVHRVIDGWREGDVVVCVEFQPRVFPVGSPWRRYAPQLIEGTGPPLEPLPMTDIHPQDPAALVSGERVWVLASAMPEGSLTFQRLRERYSREEVYEGYGWRPVLHLFSDGP